MKKILLCFYLTKTIPLSNYRIYQIGSDSKYFELNDFRETLRSLADDTYLKLNDILSEELNKNSQNFKINIFISYSTLKLFEKYVPDVIESFRDLSLFDTVEFMIGSNSFHVNDENSKNHFEDKINSHSDLIHDFFNRTPQAVKLSVFSPKLLYSIESLKTKNIFISRHLISDDVSNVLTKIGDFNLLIPNHKISETINKNFSDKSLPSWPYNTKKFIKDILDDKNDIVILDFDYESFGVVHKEIDGIFNFIKSMPQKVIESKELEFLNISELSESNFLSTQISSLEEQITKIGDMTPLQKDAYDRLFDLKKYINDLNDESIKSDWERLTSIEYFKNLHPDFFDKERYDSHYDAYVNLVNAISDLKMRIEKARLPNAGIHLDDSNQNISFSEIKDLITK